MMGRGTIIRTALFALIAAALTALAATPTQAKDSSNVRTFGAGEVVDVIGPRLAGDRLLWGQRAAGYQVPLKRLPQVSVRLVSLRPKSRVTTVAGTRLRNTQIEDFELHLAASLKGALLRYREFSPGTRYSGPSSRDLGTLRFFPFAQRLLPGCPLAALPCALPVVDVDGDRAVVSGPGPEITGTVLGLSDGSRQTVQLPGEVQDLDRGEQAGPGRGQNVRLAGRYLATVDRGDVVIEDLVTRTEVYRLRNAYPPRAIPSIDLQSDGTVVVVPDTTMSSKPAWASPAQPTLHPLKLSAREGYAALLDHGRVVFTRSAGRGRYELGTVPIGGSARILVRPVLGYSSAQDRNFDFDGSRVAWAERTCHDQRMATATIDALLARPRLSTTPRCSLALKPPLTYSHGEFGIELTCPGMERDCEAERFPIRAARTYRRGTLVVRRGALLAKPTYVRAGRTFRSATTTTAARRLARITRRPKVRISTTVRDGYPDYRQRRTRTVTALVTP